MFKYIIEPNLRTNFKDHFKLQSEILNLPKTFKRAVEHEKLESIH